jgi:hypothetical protein
VAVQAVKRFLYYNIYKEKTKKMDNEVKRHPHTGKPFNPAPMHKYLTGFDRYTKELPVYIEKPFSDEEVQILRDVIEKNRRLMDGDANYTPTPGSQEEYYGSTRYHPKKITHMSRLLIEFDCPPVIENIMDSYCKPLHKDPIRLTHYNYIDYNPIYGNGVKAPSLPPHLDADENLVTFNYMIGGNVDDWTLWVEDKPYDLKLGDAIIFSAVNQVHWRDKRKWKPGEFVEIVSFDYCPVTNYRWTGEDNPLDPLMNYEGREAYQIELANHPLFQEGWDIYNSRGFDIGLDQSQIAGFADE